MANPPAEKRRSYRAFFVVLALALVAGGAFFLYRKMTGLELRPEPLANVPKTSTLVGHVRFGPVLRSETTRMIFSSEIIDERLGRIRERCNIDPANEVDDIILFAEGQTVESLQQVGVIARGPFDYEKLRECFRKAFEDDGLGELRVGEIDGIPAVFPQDSDQRAAFLGRRAIAIGTEPTVRKIIGVVREKSANGTSDPLLARVWSRLGVGRDVVLVGRVLPALRDIVREYASAPQAARFRPFVDKVDAVGVSADLSDGLDLSIVLGMHDAASATEVKTALAAQIETLKNDMLVSLTPFGAVVRSIRVDAQDAELLVTMDLPRERLQRVLEFATRFRSNLLGGAGGAPGAAPGQPQTPPPTIVVPPPGAPTP